MMEAHSETTGKTYPSWEALLEAETNGWCVVSTTSRPNTVPFVVGPFASQADARRAHRRLARRWAKEEGRYGHTVKTYTRNLWKDERS